MFCCLLCFPCLLSITDTISNLSSKTKDALWVKERESREIQESNTFTLALGVIGWSVNKFVKRRVVSEEVLVGGSQEVGEEGD